jgi:hypothetical protein
MFKHLLFTLTLVGALSATVWAQFTIPNTFSPNTRAQSAEVNANFSLLANALDRRGGTMTGTLTTQGVLPDGNNTRDLGASGTRFANVYSVLGNYSGALTAGSTLAVTGNTTLGGTLGVTGATTLSSTLAVTGAITSGGQSVFTGSEGTYTPTWTSAGVAPALGNGTIAGTYIKVGKKVTVTITLTMGATSTYGNAANGWTFSLPFAAGAANAVGQAYALDSGGGNYYHIIPVITSGGSTLTFLVPGTGSNVTLTAPAGLTWSTGDSINVTITYIAGA